MKVKIRDEVYNRIILAKTLLRAGTDACENKRDRMTFTKGILLLHDAAEAALGAVADHLHAPLGGNCFLLEYYSLIQDNDSKQRSVPYKTQMRNLNTIRKHAKHQGILPDTITNSHFPTTVSALINDLCETYLELDFSTVSLKSLIKDEKVRILIDSAEEDIKKEKIENALVDLAFAIHYVCEDFPFRLFVPKDDKSPLLPPKTHTIEHTVRLLQHGVDPYLYNMFKTLTPMLAMEKKTGNIMHWWDQYYGHPANWTPENAKFCLDFCIDTVLKFQRDEDTRFKLIAYTDVFEDMVEATGEQATLWNRSLQPPRYGFPPTWSSSAEREATFVLKKGQEITGFARDTDPISEEWFVISKAIPSEHFSEGHGYVAKREVKVTRKKK